MGGLTGAMPCRSSRPAVFDTSLSRLPFCLCMPLLTFGELDQWAAFFCEFVEFPSPDWTTAQYQVYARFIESRRILVETDSIAYAIGLAVAQR